MTTTYPQTALAAADGTASVSWSPGSTGFRWVISQITCEISPPGALPNAYLRLNGYLVTATVAGASDAASDPPYIELTSADTLTLSWDSLTPGTIAKGVAFVDEVPS